MTRARDISNVITDADLAGNIDVDGTANLDVVDIDGAVDMASTLTVAGAFTSPGIDDNADAVALEITSSEDVVIKHGTNNAKLVFNDQSNSSNFFIQQIGSSGSPALRFFESTGDERMRIHNGGVLSVNQGVALGVGSNNTSSNVLDDYEEGTWTPSFSDLSNTPTYHILTGKYTKIGRQVMVQLSMQSNASPTFNDNNNVLAITGLPFAIDSVGYVSGVGAVSKQTLSYNGSNNNSNVTGEIVAIANTSEQINFQVSTSGGLRGNVKNVGATGGFIIELTLFYTGS